MDLLGRVTSRSGGNGANASFVWDTETKGLLTSQSGNGHSTSYTYDSAARVETTTVTIDGTAYATTTVYDNNYGRPKAMVYPAVAGNAAGLTVGYKYNGAGYLTEEINAQSGHAYRKVTAQDAFGNITGAQINNNGLTGVYTYHSTTGQMLSSKVGASHHLQYTQYDSYGNLMEVENLSAMLPAKAADSYRYDRLHRLDGSSNGYPGGTATIGYAYDAVGNIKMKTDYSTASNGAYTYVAGSNKLQSVALKAGGTDTFGYDSKGNQTHRNGSQEVWYNAFSKPTQINKNGSNIELYYGADLMRFKQVRSETDGTTTTYYIGKHFEVEQKAGEPTKYNHFISDIAILTLRDSGIPGIAYTHRDRLGSATTMTDENDNVVSMRYFDPFGKPRGGDWAQLSPARLASNLFDQRQDIRRGFTDHEHLDQAELIHMNGRVYDYNVGRFMSVDPVIQSPTNSQSINPYSYIMNNPLAGTDPTGYCSVGDGLEACSDSLEQGISQDIMDGDKVVGTVTKGANGDLTVVSNGTFEGKKGLSNAGSITVKGNAIPDIGSPKSYATHTVDTDANDIDPSLTAAVGGMVGQMATAKPALGGSLCNCNGDGDGKGKGGTGHDGWDSMDVKPTTTIVSDFLKEFSSPTSPTPDPEDDGKGGVTPEVKQFHNTISEPYHNTSPLRRLVKHNGKWRTTDSAGNYFTAKGEYEFVTIRGNTFVARPGTGHYHISHGSKSVDFVGHIRFGRGASRGQIKFWNNNSGHYKPTPDRAWQAKLPLDKFNPF